MDYVIAIPSHNRHNSINEKTIALLNYYNIDLNRVYVFVASAELAEYTKTLDKNITIVEGGLGIQKQRLAISNYFNEGQPICSMDDDLINICSVVNDKLYKIECLESLILDFFSLFDEYKCNMGGLYPVDNPYFMKNRITTDLRFIIGNFRCFNNIKKLENRKFTLLEDYETTLKYYINDGAVVRNENYVALTNYKITKWGLSYEDKDIEVIRFFNKYKQYCSIKIKKNTTDIYFKPKNHKKEILSTLWDGDLNELCTLCINSWIKQGYNVNLYSNTLEQDDLPMAWDNHVKILNAKDIYFKNNISEDIRPYSDIWRYNLLLETNETWIDADMFLLDNIGHEDTIISSEHTFQSGAYKSKLSYVPNIGLLRLNKIVDKIFIEEVLSTINKKKNELVNCDNMKIFRKILTKPKYNDIFKMVNEPNAYCPVAWWCCNEIYYDENFSKKYDVKIQDIDTILNNSTGIHLWNYFTYNKHQIDFNKTYKDSLYNRLKDYIKS